MRYQVAFQNKATSDLARLDKIVAQRILDKIHWLADNFNNLIPERLSGEFRSFYKLRIGSWRVVYTLQSQSRLITIHLIGHRREIYKTYKT